jgi:hypothetical protein
MREIKIKVYTFKELPENIQSDLIDRYRYEEVEYQWWSWVLDDYIDEVEKKWGIELENSPTFDLEVGNYIVFGGNLNKKRLLKALYKEGDISKKAYYKLTNRVNIEYFELNLLTGQYRNTIEYIDFSEEDKNGKYITDYLIDEIDLDEWFRDVISKPALKQLKETFDCLISDEYIEEMIEINEWEFTIDGKIIWEEG